MKENVECLGGVAVVVEDAWGDPVDADKVADAFKKNPDAKILAFVHAETLTGALSDAQSLVALTHQHDALAIVDAVLAGWRPVKAGRVGYRCRLFGYAKVFVLPAGFVVSISPHASARP